MTPRVLLLADRSPLPPGRDLVATVRAAVDAGLTRVVLRELDRTHAERTRLAADLAAAGASVIAARRPVGDCVAVHLAADQPVPAGLRVPFGRSCHGRADVERAAAEGASYAILSPFAATPTKPGYGPPVAPEEYADLPVPTYALGGITPANAATARAAGAHGVAVLGAVMRADDPGAVAAALLEAAG